jgi:hypothetical protein
MRNWCRSSGVWPATPFPAFFAARRRRSSNSGAISPIDRRRSPVASPSRQAQPSNHRNSLNISAV